MDAPVAAFVYDPVPQVEHADAAGPENVPSVEHGAQAIVDAPVVPRNVPAGQSEHEDTPALTANRPATHTTHVDSAVAVAAVLNFPAAHSVQSVVEPLDHAPVPHCEHVEEPVATPVNDPAGHTLHVEVPVETANWFAGHATHVDSALAPTAVLALPAAHAVHVPIVLAPVAVL